MWDGVGMRRRKKSDEMKSPGPTLIGDRSEGEKDEEVHSELTSRGPTGLGEVEEKVHVGWSRDEKMKEKKSDELTSPRPTLTGWQDRAQQGLVKWLVLLIFRRDGGREKKMKKSKLT